MPIFRTEVSDKELKKIRRTKIDIDAKNHHDFLLYLVDFYLREKGRSVL